MRIVHLTSVHRMFDGRIFVREARGMARAGHDVVVIAPGEGDADADGVRLIGVPRERSRRQRMMRTVFGVYRAALRAKGDAYHFHDPELIPIALLLKLRGRRVIYDVHEDYSLQILSKSWINPLLRPAVAMAFRFAEALAVRLFDAVIAATPPIARKFPPRKTWTVQNFPRISDVSPSAFQPYVDRPSVVVYLGGISEVRGVREMVAAMGLLPDTSDARLMLAGEFTPTTLPDELSRMAGWKRVEVLGWLSRDEVLRLLGRARVGLVVLHPIANYLESYPTKLFEYMHFGIPVIASKFPLWTDILAQAGCGLLVDPLGPHQLARAIDWLLEHPREAEQMGARGRQSALRSYTWERVELKLLDMYEALGHGRLERGRADS